MSLPVSGHDLSRSPTTTPARGPSPQSQLTSFIALSLLPLSGKLRRSPRNFSRNSGFGSYKRAVERLERFERLFCFTAVTG